MAVSTSETVVCFKSKSFKRNIVEIYVRTDKQTDKLVRNYTCPSKKSPIFVCTLMNRLYRLYSRFEICYASTLFHTTKTHTQVQK